MVMGDQSPTENISVAELCRRGWTRSLVCSVSGEPDMLVPNPHHPGGPSMKLYSRARVEAGEKRPEFIAAQDLHMRGRLP
jgi:hypothetical protein